MGDHMYRALQKAVKEGELNTGTNRLDVKGDNSDTAPKVSFEIERPKGEGLTGILAIKSPTNLVQWQKDKTLLHHAARLYVLIAEGKGIVVDLGHLKDKATSYKEIISYDNLKD
jgi:hypothetical protein